MKSPNSSTPESADSLPSQGWALVLAARELIDQRQANGSTALHYKAANSSIAMVASGSEQADLYYHPECGWRCRDGLPSSVKTLCDLYLPVLGTQQQPRVVVGHLGQSLDARIATTEGDAFFVTGEENRRHLHRLRALCHAVIVGAETVMADDPQLTTRAVEGPSPVRVVIDPKARLPDSTGLLQGGSAPTWLVHSDEVEPIEAQDNVHRLYLPLTRGRLSYSQIIKTLAEHGLERVFVEGGGVTVSGMLMDNCLDYLQVATAPILVGEGRPAVQLPGVPTMRDALRPPFQLYRMGEDVLWHFDLRGIDLAEGAVEARPAQTSQASHSLERLL